jgi:hypothetical protein
MLCLSGREAAIPAIIHNRRAEILCLGAIKAAAAAATEAAGKAAAGAADRGARGPGTSLQISKKC